MRPCALLCTLLAIAQLASARSVQEPTVPELFELAPLVVTGEVAKIEPTGIETSLSYPTLDGVIFHWLRVTCKVGPLLKGSFTGANIGVAMLAIRKSGKMGLYNGPLMLEPKVGIKYVMFLAPTPTPGLHASLLAPYDENNAIFVLDRKDREYDAGSYTVMDPDYRKKWQEKKDLVWSLTTWLGGLSKTGSEAVIRQYRPQIAKPGKAITIPLEWKTYTNPSGWSWDVPKDAAVPAPKSK